MVIRLSASLKLRRLRATVCEPTVDVVLGEVLVILKNNNVAHAPMAKAVELVFYPRRSVVRACHGIGTRTFYWQLLYDYTYFLWYKNSWIFEKHENITL